MIRLNLVLVLAVVCSALYLVAVQYDSRRIFVDLERARNQAHRLGTEHDRLEVEKRGQATPARVERLAKSQLQMRQTTPGITSYVTYSAPEPVAAAPLKQAASMKASGVVQ
jgi:cell division protein FtsL